MKKANVLKALLFVLIVSNNIVSSEAFGGCSIAKHSSNR